MKDTGSWLRKRLLLQRYFLEAVFHWWCCVTDTRRIAFCGRQFPPLSHDAALSRQTAPHCRLYSTAATGVFIVCCSFNKSLGTSSPKVPSLVLCLIHCRSPTPSAINVYWKELIFNLGDPPAHDKLWAPDFRSGGKTRIIMAVNDDKTTSGDNIELPKGLSGFAHQSIHAVV